MLDANNDDYWNMQGYTYGETSTQTMGTQYFIATSRRVDLQQWISPQSLWNLINIFMAYSWKWIFMWISTIGVPFNFYATEYFRKLHRLHPWVNTAQPEGLRSMRSTVEYQTPLTREAFPTPWPFPPEKKPLHKSVCDSVWVSKLRTC
jgi:hypothetical protein